MAKVLVATEKPFHPKGVEKIKEIYNNAGAEWELTLLEKYPDKSQLLEAVKDAEAIIVRSDKITQEIIDAAPNLKIVVRAGAGYDNVDTEAASAKNVVVMNTPGQNSNAVAELAFCMMTYFARNKLDASQGTELRGKKLGIHAYGNVGRYVAEIGKGFGMEVYAYDPFVPKDLMEKDGVKSLPREDLLYKTCQFISLHVPSNEKTRGGINFNLMNSMPEHAVLVNTARKEVINDDFYYLSDIAPNCKDELESKYPDRVLFTPKKMGAQTVEANMNAAEAAANQIINYFESGDVTFQVNK
ncbi:MAG: NAD(P)-dependent oxidoreductase [Bacteroidota bacterium]